MSKIEIYTSAFCPYCAQALKLLRSKNQNFEQIDVSADRALRQKMTERAKGKTSVPQIFIDGEHIGGCDTLHSLERAGHLDKLLAG